MGLLTKCFYILYLEKSEVTCKSIQYETENSTSEFCHVNAETSGMTAIHPAFCLAC